MPPILKTISLLFVIIIIPKKDILPIFCHSDLMNIITFAKNNIIVYLKICIKEHYPHIIFSPNLPLFLTLEFTFLTTIAHTELITYFENTSYSCRTISLPITWCIDWMKFYLLEGKSIFNSFINVDPTYMGILWPSISKRDIIKLIPIINQLLFNAMGCSPDISILYVFSFIIKC